MKNIVIKLGDISDSVVDAIVNAGNSSLKLGGGVSGAINLKGGPTIQKQLDAIRLGIEMKIVNEGGDVLPAVIPQGTVVVTSGGNLKCKQIIHAAVVGQEEINENILRTAIRNSFETAHTLKCQSLAFPALGTGSGRFPVKNCAEVMIDEVVCLLEKDSCIRGVMFVLYEEEDFKVFENVLKSKGISYKTIGKT